MRQMECEECDMLNQVFKFVLQHVTTYTTSASLREQLLKKLSVKGSIVEVWDEANMLAQVVSLVEYSHCWPLFDDHQQ